jgi:threonine dehydrogenase-like Zn-dependent dehydrogenase
VKPGQFVVGSFCISDNTCPHCRFGFPSSCEQREFMSGAQAPYARVPLADGTLVATPEMPSDDLVPGLLATSDVLGTGWYAADAARVRPGSTVAVVGDGAVGLMGVLAARQMGAERVIAMSRHERRQQLALEYGATDVVAERGDAGVERVKALTDGIGADSVLECVGTQESMSQAIRCARPGAMIGYVGVPHGVQFDGQTLFFSQTGMQGGPAPVRRFLPHLIDLVLTRRIDPGKIFDLELPLADVAEGYRAMDERLRVITSPGRKRAPLRRLPRHGLRLPGRAHAQPARGLNRPRTLQRVETSRAPAGGQAGAGRACARPGKEAAMRSIRTRRDHPGSV